MLKDFSELQHVHESLDELFLMHQIAVVRLDAQRALNYLARFHAEIEKHIRYEEDVLLPLYAERGGNELEGGRVDFYVKEHKKILELLEELAQSLSRLSLPDNDEGARKALELLEKEHPLKTLVDHHDRREHAFLYPFLDQVTNAEEKRTMLESAPVPRS